MNEAPAVSMLMNNAALLPVSSPRYKEMSCFRPTPTKDFGVLYKCFWHFVAYSNELLRCMCLDILKELQRENAFLFQLTNVYDTITALT